MYEKIKRNVYRYNNLLKIKNYLLGVAVGIGSVANICERIFMFEKYVLQYGYNSRDICFHFIPFSYLLLIQRTNNSCKNLQKHLHLMFS